MTEPVVQVTGLSKRFATGADAVTVLAELSFALPAGASLALTGRSGSGKSTLLNLLCGLEAPEAGRLQVFGEAFAAGDDGVAGDASARWARLRRRAIGVVFQDANLMPALTLLENVRLRATLAGQPTAPAADWLARLGLAELANRYPDQVSGGQRQRAALAMVFAMNPGLILADEPTGSLDHHTADDVADSLFSLQQHSGCGLILATHDPALAARCQYRLDLGHDRPELAATSALPSAAAPP
ncbi:ATP-binding cassette domain-containing protein [Marinobacter lipolyticus]|uniref:ABC transporter ATP-binding protein n=1 Tax=Marinobacter lipolyticus TaxID=209639 RepID=UPI001BCA7E8A|nr:ATP-binding cassette domain-containing protein [Marinobacter lipolyticus]MBS8242169.1 ATP-binding cassette domain-containing protein [Marinobacter lipolyticus]